MIILVQRVSEARVDIKGETTASIGAGMLILIGVHVADSEREAEALARKCAQLRIFADDDGKMNRSLLDCGGDALVVSQFTLYGDAARGNRPSFTRSAPPEKGERLYRHFVDALSEALGRPVPTGVFGASMQVRLINDGPVTLWLEKKAPDASSEIPVR
ncbi:MAG: D-aminoacyl-tRNA deacylase [Rhodothermales bacterium]|nr:D-aminoacyl-tRNA deacylase [Rhodothermales bacterium]